MKKQIGYDPADQIRLQNLSAEVGTPVACQERHCWRCDRTKPVTEFYVHKTRGYQDQCKKCKNAYNKDHYAKNKDSYKRNAKKQKTIKGPEIVAFINSLKNKPCMDCGGRFPPCAMDFDHVRGDKRMNVSLMRSNSVKTILEEVSKCELVCSNCHRIRTYDRMKK